MGFTNLYTKSTANPKDIDFATVGTRVKNKIPDAAIKAFQAKVPKPLAKPFEFTFDKDHGNGKLQITVKQIGFVYGWVDQTLVAAKAKMKVVEDEIETWRTRISESAEATEAIRGRMDVLAKKVETAEQTIAAKQATPAMAQEFQATKLAVEKLIPDGQKIRGETLTFWTGGPDKGVIPLMKKHGLQAEEVGGEKDAAVTSYAQLQQSAKNFFDQFVALGKEVEALDKRAEQAAGNLYLQTKTLLDRKSEREDLEVEIQKAIGDIQGYKNSDFSGTGAKGLVKDAKEFASKTGTAWTKLSATPAEIEKTATQVQQVIERLRILGGRAQSEYSAWQKSSIPQGGQMVRFQKMLTMVYEEYANEHNATQSALQNYKTALLKQKTKATELIAKATKKQEKSDAKAAKKGR